MSLDPNADADATITRYLASARAGAALDEADLAELDDHLRTSVLALRRDGVPPAEAAATACARLGEPALVARELARVRTRWGTPLPWPRAVAAVAVLAPTIVVAMATARDAHTLSLFGVAGVGALIGCLGLVFGRTALRSLMFGGVASYAAVMVALVADGWRTGAVERATVLQSAAAVAATGLLAPWSRRELSRAGWALALQGTTLLGTAMLASFALWLDRYVPGQTLLPLMATGLAVVAAVGLGLGARWGSVLVLVVAALDAVAMARFAPAALALMPAGAPAWFFIQLDLVLGGIVAAAVAAWLAWPGARRGGGTWRALVA